MWFKNYFLFCFSLLLMKSRIERKVKRLIDQKAEYNVWPKSKRPNRGAKKGGGSGPSLAPYSFWTTILAYLIINCTILYFSFGFSLIFAIWTMICRIFCLKPSFHVIRPFNFRPINCSAFLIFFLHHSSFVLVYLARFTFGLMSFGCMLQYQKLVL